MAILKSIFSSNERDLSRLRPLQEAVLAKKAEVEKLSDAGLQAKTAEFRQRIANGEPVDRVLPDAFAVIRETSRRIVDMEHFPVQILGAIVLHQGRIAEMQTGEGKTVVSTMPGYLNAVAGRTVHVITVNDYLAGRDREWMGQIYRFLGIPVGLVVPNQGLSEKIASYKCPVIYGTNTEFGFDYLRDNMARRKEDLVQGKLDYAIIDEVDSILVDEARTPLIISGAGEGGTDDFKIANDVAKRLRKDADYTVEEKDRVVYLTDDGERKAEGWLGVDALTTDEKDWRPYVRQALAAKEIMEKDVDYVVQDGQILIVDEFTGRILLGRRFSDGLHEAIEAKEGVEVRSLSDTLATITVQNFFRMYKKLAGMTGTAMTEEPEFQEIYGLDVVAIPTNRDLIRTAHPDSIWKTEKAKFRAVVEDIVSCHEQGRPTLVGTRSVEKSEMLSGMLQRRGVPHEVLNAKQHAREAEIVAQAGRKGAVTIATNMAGRGTDILLGGNPAFLARRALRQEGSDPEVVAIASEKVLPEDMAKRVAAGDIDETLAVIVKARERYGELFSQFKKVTDAEHEEVVGLGGLHVVGTERHEARRIDNQLRGRAGRQGDPGSSRFYLSVEDELMRLFGGDAIASMMDRVGFSEDEPIEHRLVTKSVETAQKRVEAHNFEIRKNVVEYDNVLNKQRETMYADRRKVLEADDTRPVIEDMVGRVIEMKLDLYWPKNTRKDESDVTGLELWAKDVLPQAPVKDFLASAGSRDQIQAWLRERIDEVLRSKAEGAGSDWLDLTKAVMLWVTDREWVSQLHEMDGLREGVGLQAYGQRDPLVEYTRISYEMFQGHMQNIAENTIRYLCRIEVKGRTQGQAPAQSVRVMRPVREAPRRATGPSSSGSTGAGASASGGGKSQGPAPVRVGKKVGRNDPCPCGSGKKYKDCCGKIV